MARLGAFHGGEDQAANDAAELGDARLVDVGQRVEPQAAEVEVDRAVRPLAQARGLIRLRCLRANLAPTDYRRHKRRTWTHPPKGLIDPG